MTFKCELVDWTFMPAGIRLRATNWLKCSDDDTEYRFSETTLKQEPFFISKKTPAITDSVVFYCDDCVEMLKEFLNSEENHTICKCHKIDSLYEFEKLDNGDLRVGSTTTIFGKEDTHILDIDSSIVPTLKDFLNLYEWDMGNKDTIQNGLDIIREKIENCDLSVLDYIKIISSEMEVGLFEQKITIEDYKEFNDRIFRLIERFKTNCYKQIT